MSKRIVILAITAKHIKTDVEGNQYIENDTEVAARLSPDVTVANAMLIARAKFPNSLGFEIYEPATDADEVDRV